VLILDISSGDGAVAHTSTVFGWPGASLAYLHLHILSSPAGATGLTAGLNLIGDQAVLFPIWSDGLRVGPADFLFVLGEAASNITPAHDIAAVGNVPVGADSMTVTVSPDSAGASQYQVWGKVLTWGRFAA